jgi:20S proteasome alpha/beta subunit
VTLVLAASGPDFIVVGADSRGTVDAGARSEINTMNKIVPVARHVVILFYGAADEALYLVKRFKYMYKNIDGVSDVAEKFAEFCRDEARKVADVPRHPDDIPRFGFIIAGLDREGKGRVYKVPRSYSMRSTNGFMLGRPDPLGFGGKPFVALYLFSQRFGECKSRDDICEFVAQCIYDTMSVDGDVGGKIRISIIDSGGIINRPEASVRKGLRQWGPPVV